jgi:hypothetical protein
MMSFADRPTYVSEWDAPWPNAYRADSVIYSAAFGMFQGWSGFAIHTYSYSTKLERMNILGKEINAEKIADVPYRQGIFSAWNDPAKFGLFYHAALLTRRGDVKVGNEVQTLTPVSRASWGVDRLVPVAEKHVTVASFDGSEGPVVEADETAVDVRSDTGELYRNFTDNYGYVDTEMTKCAFGMLEKNGEVAMNGMKVRSKTDFAVIALSSLTDAPISTSDNILMTTVGRAQNTDAKFFTFEEYKNIIAGEQTDKDGNLIYLYLFNPLINPKSMIFMHKGNYFAAVFRMSGNIPDQFPHTYALLLRCILEGTEQRHGNLLLRNIHA